MFEQESYNQAAAAQQSRAGDLFHNYEIRNWDFSPKIYKILAISAVLNLFALAFIGQTNLLTLKGCQSPFVGRVCQVMDTVYVGALLFGTEREYVDAEYDRIDLGDADITYIDVSGETPPLSYPEGYFQIANPVQYAMMQQQATNADNPANDYIPGFPGLSQNPTTGSDFMNTPPVTPMPNPDALRGDARSPFKFGGYPTTSGRKARRGGRTVNMNSNSEIPPDETVADNNSDNTSETPTAAASDPVKEVEINKKPGTDLAEFVLAKQDAKEVDLNRPFTVVLDGFLTADGKLDKNKSKWDTRKEVGDPAMIEVAKQAVEAVSQSGMLGYLRNLGVEKLSFTLTQNENEVVAVVSSGQKTPNHAKTLSSGMNGLMTLGKLRAKNPSDERTLLDNATWIEEGTNFVLNFKIPKAVAQEIINRKLQEAQAKKQLQAQPNGTAEIKPVDNKTQK